MSVLALILIFIGIWLLITCAWVFFVLYRGGRSSGRVQSRRAQPPPLPPRFANSRHDGSGQSDDSFANGYVAAPAVYTSDTNSSNSDTGWSLSNDTSQSSTDYSSSSSSDYGGGGSGGDW